MKVSCGHSLQTNKEATGSWYVHVTSHLRTVHAWLMVKDFYDTLLAGVYLYQEVDMFYICGDFNSRCADKLDYVDGVDNIPGRRVVDHRTNGYGDLLCEFLISANCCMLNGRTEAGSDFTLVSANGQSVVD